MEAYDEQSCTKLKLKHLGSLDVTCRVVTLHVIVIKTSCQSRTNDGITKKIL